MRDGSSRRTRAGAVTPSSSSTPSASLRERLVRRFALDLGLVDLLDLVPRMREPVREVSVVREQEDARCVRVEPADRDDAGLVLDEADDGGPTLRVARRRDDSGRLVQKNVGELLRDEKPAVEIDDVTLLDEGVQLAAHTVHAHAAGLDQLVGAPPGRNASARKVGIQSHLGSFAPGTILSPTRAHFLSTIAVGRRSAVPEKKLRPGGVRRVLPGGRGARPRRHQSLRAAAGRQGSRGRTLARTVA